MQGATGYTPTYSHGGGGTSGSVTGHGRAISVLAAIRDSAMYVFVIGGDAVVKFETSGAAMDSTGNPPDESWVDFSSGGFTVTPTTPIYKRIPAPSAPLWRTNIVSLDPGATVESGIAQIIIAGPQGPTAVGASYPSVSNTIDPRR